MPLFFRLGENGPPLVKDILEELGWKDHDEAPPSTPWNLWWKSSCFKASEVLDFEGFQRCNHFPKLSSSITTKNALYRNIRRMFRTYGRVFGFVPHTFLLPGEMGKFVESMRQQRKEAVPRTWIYKPADSSRGRGVFLFTDAASFQSSPGSGVVQRYVEHPLTICGYKFDMRIYVLVASFSPLTVYIFEEGLVRFSSEKYDPDSGTLDNLFVHLTNSSINTRSASHDQHKPGIGRGCKWSLARLRAYCESRGIPYAPLWKQICNIVVLTLLCVDAGEQEQFGRSCFELFGFDIMFDSNLTAWLLEVNLSPALTTECEEDVVIKGALIRDLMALLDIEAVASAHSKAVSSYSSALRPRRAPRRVVRHPPPVPQMEKVGGFQLIFPFSSEAAEAHANPGNNQPDVHKIIRLLKSAMKESGTLCCPWVAHTSASPAIQKESMLLSRSSSLRVPLMKRPRTSEAAEHRGGGKEPQLPRRRSSQLRLARRLAAPTVSSLLKSRRPQTAGPRLCRLPMAPRPPHQPHASTTLARATHASRPRSTTTPRPPSDLACRRHRPASAAHMRARAPMRARKRRFQQAAPAPAAMKETVVCVNEGTEERAEDERLVPRPPTAPRWLA